MTPLERAAEAAIAEIERGGGDYIPPYIERRSGHVVIDGEVDMRAVVRAVLQAIREPSDDQLIEAQRAMFGSTHSAPPSSALTIGFQAMIDTALSE